MKLRQIWDENKARKWMWAALLIFVGLQIYFVQEMLAALILFTAIFAAFATIALALYLVDRAGKWSLGWASQHTGPAWQWTRRAWHAVEGVSKKQIRRPRSEPAR